MMTLSSIAPYLIPLGVGLALLAWSARFLRSRRAAGSIAIAGLLYFAMQVATIAASPTEGRFDFTAFWEAGREVLSGVDPIAGLVDNPMPPLNPPTAYPLFAALAKIPYRTSYALWTAINGLLMIATAWVAWIFVERSGRTDPDGRITFLLVSATLALSNACRSGLISGQLSILTAFFLTLAVDLRGRDRPALAGVSLAVATIKIGTMVPFLLLFLRRRDLIVWLSAGVIALGLTLTTGGLLELPDRTRDWLGGIAFFSEPGRTNDFAYTSTKNDDMIGLDHAFYRLGLRSRTAAKIAQAATLGLIGLGLLVEIAWRRRFSERASASLVAVYSALFLYHRLADLVILALPLIEAVRVARRSDGGVRARALLVVGSLLAAIFLQRKALEAARILSVGRPGLLAELVQAFVLPYATWLLLAALGLIWFDARRASRTDQQIR